MPWRLVWGDIFIELIALESLLTLENGEIHAREEGTDIILEADNFDFISGNRKILGTGELFLRANQDVWEYRIGTAAENSFGEKLLPASEDSPITDNDMYESAAAMLATRDINAIGTTYNRVQVGRRDDGNIIEFGDAYAMTEDELGTSASYGRLWTLRCFLQ